MFFNERKEKIIDILKEKNHLILRLMHGILLVVIRTDCKESSEQKGAWIERIIKK